MTAVGRMWGEEREKEHEVEDLESGRDGEVTGPGGSKDERRREWNGSEDGGRELDERGDAVDRRFVSAATADSGRPAFL